MISNFGISLYGRPIVDFYEQTAMAWSGLWDLKGSLLPFSGMGHHYYRHPLHLVNELELDTHHSINDWSVLTSGRVAIPSACILSSSIEDDNVPKSELRYVFWGFLGREDGKRASILQGSDIHKWTKERRSEIHLVVVMSGVMHETQSTGGRPATGPDLDYSGSTAGEQEGYVRSIMHVAQGIVLRSTKADSQKAAERKGRVRDLKGKPQRLVKIGNFLCYTDGRIILPETRRVDWEIL